MRTIFLFVFVILSLLTPVALAVDLTVSSSNVTLFGDLSYTNIYITGGSYVTIATYNGTAGTGYLNLTASNVFTLDSTSYIIGTEKGLTGGAGGPIGTTGSTGLSSGYGSAGTGGSGTFTSFGPQSNGVPGTYGSNVSLGYRLGNGAGGGGGGSPYACWGVAGSDGSNGGGAINIKATTLNVAGTINMIGGAGGAGGHSSCYHPGGAGGGSSGGTIWLNGTSVLNVTGTLSTYAPGQSGGIALHYGTSNDIASLTTNASLVYSSLYLTDIIPNSTTITSPTTGTLLETSYVNVTWNPITDPFGAVSYNIQFSNDSSFATNITQYNTSNTYYNASLGTGQIYSRVRSNNSYQLSEWSPSIYFYLGVATLYVPANNSVYNISFPSLTSDISFIWSLPSGYASQLQLARDPSFIDIVQEPVVASGSLTLSLSASQYYWRVRFYNIATSSYYSWGPAFTFTVNSIPPTLTPPAIYGVIYQTIDSTRVPISGATVSINDILITMSGQSTTGPNGYYQFLSLVANGTYTLRVSAPGFKDSNLEVATISGNSTFEKSIEMIACTSSNDCYYNQQFATFKLMSLRGPVKGAVVTVYKGSEVIPAMSSAVTAPDGTVRFQLLSTTSYRVTFINATSGLSKTWTGIPQPTTIVYINDSGGSTFVPRAITNTSQQVYYETQTDLPFSFQNMTGIYLTSNAGLGPMAQGILVGITNYLLIGLGGIFSVFIAMCIFAVMGILSWTMVLFIGMTAISIFVLLGGIGS